MDTPTDPYAYLATRAFHQTFFCPRTNTLVSYSACGRQSNDAPLVFFVPPSGCSRWVGVLKDGAARKAGVRLITIDRPGQGTTQNVKVSERVKVSVLQMVSLLELLCTQSNSTDGYKGNVTFMAHSAGVYYLLPLLNLLLSRNGQMVDSSNVPYIPIASNIFFTSPYVPPIISGERLLSLFPGSLIRNSHTIFPAIASMSFGVGNMWEWSTGLVLPSSSTTSVKKGPKLKDHIKYPTATLHPPFTTNNDSILESAPVVSWISAHKLGNSFSNPAHMFSSKLLMDYWMLEGAQGMTEDYAFCLGKGVEGGQVTLVKMLEDGFNDLGTGWKERCLEGELPSVTVVWACEDGLIPKKGRDWLDQIIGEINNLRYRREEMGGGAGHDDPLAADVVKEMIFDSAKHRM